MVADASIYGRIQPFEQPNLLAQAAQGAQLSGVLQQNKLAQLQMAEYERARQQEEAARGVYAGFGADTAANQQALYKAGLGKEALAYGKSAAEAQKAQLEQQAAQFKLAHDKSVALRNIIGGVKDQAGYTQGLRAAQALGLDVSNEPLDYNPAYVANLAEQTRTQQERIEAELKQRGFDVTMRGQDITRQNAIDTNATSRANNANTVGATIRGQNLSDARARETNALQRDAARSQVVETENGPVLVDKGTGQARAVTLNGAQLPAKEKPLNEGQSKAALFGSRMQAANQIFDDLARNGTTTATPGMRAPVVGGVVTALSSSNQQSLDQARRDFINATLRRESGAAIADSEFDNADRQYFPQVGDSPAVIAQKKANRERATRGILEEVPERQRDSIVRRINGPGQAAPSTGGWSVKEVK